MKALSREQLESRKEKAVRFVRDVLEDPERAAEIDAESLEDYAERRRIQLTNPQRSTASMATKSELEKRIRELEDENQELSDQLDDVAAIVSPADEDEDDEDAEGEYDEDEDESPE